MSTKRPLPALHRVTPRDPRRLLRHPADRAQAPRQLHRGDPPVRRGPGPRRPGDLLHRRPSRALGRLRPRRAARAPLRHDRDPARRRPRPGALHPLSPVRRPRAHRADLAALGGDLPRRPQPHDPVQGKVGEAARTGLLGALLLPGADGGRRPRLPGDRGPGRRRPATARRADAGDRPPLQRALRRDAGGARPGHPGGRRPDHGPAGAGAEDVDDRRHRGRHRPRPRRARRDPQEARQRRHRLRAGGAPRPRQARRHQPDRHPRRRPRRRARGDRGRVRGRRLRRLQEGGGRGGGRAAGAGAGAIRGAPPRRGGARGGLGAGAERARAICEPIVAEVRDRMGIGPG